MLQRSALHTSGWTIAVLCASAFATAAASTVQLKPGLWRLEAKTETQGMPVPIAPQDRVFTRCLRGSQAHHPWQVLQQSSAGECVFKDFRRSGQAMAYQMQCAGKDGAITGHGSADFSNPTRYHSQSDLHMGASGLNITMHTTIAGRWLGACSS